MARYKLEFKASVATDLRPIPKADVARTLSCVEGLREDPRPPVSEKLSGRERYRIRQGIYRIIYEVVDDHLIVTVVKVGHRRYVYRHP